VNSLYTAEGVMDKHSLWQRYVPLVRHEALRLQVRLPASVELDDLLQAGGIGLLNAVERYDALQGTAFTTYAVQRIRGAMLDELRSRDWVPRSVRRNAREVAQAIGQLEQELGRNATETEVAERLGIDIADYRQMLLDTNNSQLFSYDEWREEHGDSIELVTDDHQRENPLQQLLDNNLRQRVMEEIKYWARWVMEQTQCDGFRLDAVKHIPAWFYKEWIEHVQEVAPKPLFIVAEYWSHEVDKLQTYIDQVEGKTMLFDAPLQMKFHEASRMGRDYDMTQIFTGTLVEADPFHAVTLVANHDTQPLQALEAPVEPWFKPLAYALILLRENGVPSVFYPDLYGAHYEDVGGDGQTYPIDMPIIEQLDELILARQRFAHGVQTLFFDHPNCIAFSRSGTDEYPGCVVVMSNGDDGEKTINLGENYGNKTWRDFLGSRQESVVTDENGEATFFCNGGSVSVWVIEEVI
jgi:FliA/WhiG family RNA polymerase sigma factor